ncbi:MAG: glycoside hydrolase family 43 protein [Lacunisphaera sp.]
MLVLGVTTSAAEPAPVAFDSFTYTGRDAVFDSPLPAGRYRNPILAGFYPDPSVCRVGDDYYLVNSTFGYFPGIPLFHSRDLVNWTQLGHVIDRPTQLNYDGVGITRGIFAPALSHHDGTFYLVCTMVDAGGNFVVTATNPAGPWSDPVWLNFDGIDPSLFFDDDGRAWLVNNGNPPDNQPLYQGHRAIWIQEFDYRARKLVGPRRIIVNGGVDLAKKPVWIEGPHLYRRNGWYYLCCAEGGTSVQHSQVILRSKSVTGPFVPWDQNPILTQRDLDSAAPHAITCTGHADLVIGPDGQWWSTFLACRPYAGGKLWATGRETFLLPVTWTDDGWPVILPRGERVPYVSKAPAGPALVAGPRPADKRQPCMESLTGNFTWHDDFDQPALSFAWIMARAPKEKWWQLAGGHLNLVPRADRLSGKGNPSFLARRIQHAKFEAAAKLEVPAAIGTSAGLVLFQSENHHYYFAIKRTAAGLEAFLEKWNGQAAEILASKPLGSTKSVTLTVAVDERQSSFSLTADDGQPVVLVPAEDALAITVQAAGDGLHFTGAVVGLHARTE